LADGAEWSVTSSNTGIFNSPGSSSLSYTSADLQSGT
jgi:hypothetical protein